MKKNRTKTQERNLKNSINTSLCMAFSSANAISVKSNSTNHTENEYQVMTSDDVIQVSSTDNLNMIDVHKCPYRDDITYCKMKISPGQSECMLCLLSEINKNIIKLNSNIEKRNKEK